MYISFSFPIYPEIQDYLTEAGIHNLYFHTIKLEEVKNLLKSIKSSLDNYFNNEYIEVDYGKFRPKCIRSAEFSGKKYQLKLVSSQSRSIKLYNILYETFINKGEIILYGKEYLGGSQVHILNVINKEKINDKTQLIARMDAGQHPNLKVENALLDLQEKGFVVIDNQNVITTDAK